MFAINLIAYAIHGRPETVVLFAIIFTLSRIGFWLGYIVYACCGPLYGRGFVAYGIMISTFMMYQNALWIMGGTTAA
jgi:hypothetical protein